MVRKPAKQLQRYMFDNPNILEIGIDEAGRGPLFGRVYAAAVILPKDNDVFPHELMKDSKKFTNRAKLNEVAQIIMDKCIAYSVNYAENTEIDKLNPLKATMKIMNDCVSEILDNFEANNDVNDINDVNDENSNQSHYLLVDGSYFRPRMRMSKDGMKPVNIPYTCVTSGDDTFTSIAAASILAKYHRDNYIDAICDENEGLDELYDLRKNKGYGTAKHMSAIKKYGITKWHRKSFGICKNANVIEIEISE